MRALNVVGGGEQAARLFRPWEERADTSVLAESEDSDDPEIIIHVPLTSDVKLKSIAIIGGSGGSAPSQMRVWINRDDIDFSNVGDVEPLQEWSLNDGGLEALEYPTRYMERLSRQKDCHCSLVRSWAFRFRVECSAWTRWGGLEREFDKMHDKMLCASLSPRAHGSGRLIQTNFCFLHPYRYTKFQGVNSITFHFPKRLRGSGRINIHFIGLKGSSHVTLSTDWVCYSFAVRRVGSQHAAVDDSLNFVTYRSTLLYRLGM